MVRKGKKGCYSLIFVLLLPWETEEPHCECLPPSRLLLRTASPKAGTEAEIGNKFCWARSCQCPATTGQEEIGVVRASSSHLSCSAGSELPLPIKQAEVPIFGGDSSTFTWQ